LHWYLDVVFAEDRQRGRKDHLLKTWPP
jgi:predicted transposase YbfD/YdcC